MVCRHPNAFVMDFMIESPLTTRDEHYLDPVHYTADAATIIADAIAAGVIHQENNPNFVFLCDRLDNSGPPVVVGQNESKP
jgi:hypothetical protein